MHFGSKYIYIERPNVLNSEYPRITLESATVGLESGIMLENAKCEDDNVAKDENAAAATVATPPASAAAGNLVDTNVMAVKFDVLQEPAHMQTGDAVRCPNSDCMAILSHLSRINDDPNNPNNKLWQCEFCGKEHSVDCEPEQQPKQSDVTYLLEAAPHTVNEEGKIKYAGASETMVVFCVDVSGSMSTRTQVGGEYTSRIRAAQAAIINQLGTLEREHPDRRVMLVAFEDTVHVYGDGSGPSKDIQSRKTDNLEELSRFSKDMATPGMIKDTRQQLEAKVKALHDMGSTALGPALYISVCLAGRVPGSLVVVCTDGCANEGLGQLEFGRSRLTGLQGPDFYPYVGEHAKQLGVTVNFMTFKGTDTRLIEIGQVAQASGGQVSIVDAGLLGDQMRALLAERFVASQVEASLIAHKALYWEEDVQVKGASKSAKATTKDESASESNAPEKKLKLPEGTGKSSRLFKVIGNVSHNTTLTFRFGFRADTQLEGTDQLPFQVQIKYRDVDGNVALRVITATREQTQERDEAVEESDVRVIGTYVAQNVPKLQKKGQFATADKVITALKESERLKIKPEAAQVYQELDKLQSQNKALHNRLKGKGRDDDFVDGYSRHRTYRNYGIQLESATIQLESACIPESATIDDSDSDEEVAQNEATDELEDMDDEDRVRRAISDEMAEQIIQFESAHFI